MDTACSWYYTVTQTGIMDGCAFGTAYFGCCIPVGQSILSAAIHDLAGWAPAGKSLYHALACAALLKEGTSCSRRSIMKQERKPYLSVGIDISADFSLMAIALPMQEIVGKSYKILHSSTRSVQGAVDRILGLCQTHNLPARVYMESTSISTFRCTTGSRRPDWRCLFSTPL